MFGQRARELQVLAEECFDMLIPGIMDLGQYPYEATSTYDAEGRLVSEEWLTAKSSTTTIISPACHSKNPKTLGLTTPAE